jgi:hypothetical protein
MRYVLKRQLTLPRPCILSAYAKAASVRGSQAQISLMSASSRPYYAHSPHKYYRAR